MSLLVELGADLDKPTWAQRTPLELAVALGRDAIAERLRQAGAEGLRLDTLDLFDAAKLGALQRIEALLPDMDETGRDNAVQAAASDGGLAAIRAIHAAGISSSALDGVLRTACAQGEADLVAFALEAGANVGAITQPVGRPPLEWAAANGHAAVCQQLLVAGADVDQPTDGDAFTALQEAVSHGHPDTVRVLLAAGADADRAARDGSSARSLAAPHPAIRAALDPA